MKPLVTLDTNKSVSVLQDQSLIRVQIRAGPWGFQEFYPLTVSVFQQRSNCKYVMLKILFPFLYKLLLNSKVRVLICTIISDRPTQQNLPKLKIQSSCLSKNKIKQNKKDGQA